MAVLTAQQITQAGIKPTTVTPAVSGDTLKNTAIQFFHVQNASASTIVVDPLLGTLKKENVVLSLAAGEEGFLGPFEVDAFNDVNGNITITCSAQTSVKLSALYL